MHAWHGMCGSNFSALRGLSACTWPAGLSVDSTPRRRSSCTAWAAVHAGAEVAQRRLHHDVSALPAYQMQAERMIAAVAADVGCSSALGEERL